MRSRFTTTHFTSRSRRRVLLAVLRFLRRFATFKGKRNYSTWRERETVLGGILHTRETQDKKKKKLKLFFSCGLLVLFLVAWFSVVAFTPYFYIQTYVVHGLRRIPQEKVRMTVDEFLNRKVFFVIPQKNYFFVSHKRLKTYLNTRFPIEKVVITKSFPDNLNIEITEKLGSVIYDSGVDYQLVDENGAFVEVIRTVDERDTLDIVEPRTSTVHFPHRSSLGPLFEGIPIVYDSLNRARERDRVERELLEALEHAQETIEASLGKEFIHHFELSKDNERFVDIIVQSPGLNKLWTIKFTLDSDQNIVWNDFIQLWNTITAAKRAQLDYVDMRFEGRAYYK